METRKFKDHQHASAWVITHETGEQVLISYMTAVAEVDAEGWLKINTISKPDGSFSKTSLMHIGWFMRELGITYEPCKLARQLLADHARMNIHTGEVKFDVV